MNLSVHSLLKVDLRSLPPDLVDYQIEALVDPREGHHSM